MLGGDGEGLWGVSEELCDVPEVVRWVVCGEGCVVGVGGGEGSCSRWARIDGGGVRGCTVQGTSYQHTGPPLSVVLGTFWKGGGMCVWIGEEMRGGVGGPAKVQVQEFFFRRGVG